MLRSVSCPVYQLHGKLNVVEGCPSLWLLTVTLVRVCPPLAYRSWAVLALLGRAISSS